MIDSHAHLVTDDIKNYPPSPPAGTPEPDLANAMTVERLLQEMDRNGVDKAVLVQRGSIYGFDSSYVCDSAWRYPTRLAAVCSIDATAEDCAERVRYWTEARGAVGIRLMELVKGMNISWLDSPLARTVWRAALERDIPVCVHFFPWNRTEGLTRLRDILTEMPDLTVVIDHFAAIKSDAGPPDHGVDDLLARVADFAGVTVKFTTIPLGRLQEAGIDAHPIVERVAELFGPERMMWGSDITQSLGTYEHMAALGRGAVANLPPAAQRDILIGTARRVYGRNWN
ncbi:MAG: amidohydrolase [Sphingomonadales bacterium]|nr:amidohydrolase [Sphingomonadales bacterium]